MKKIFLLLASLLCFFCLTYAQVKMIAKSTYGYNGTTFYLRDSSQYFNNPANLNPVNENFTEAYNYAIYDSSHYYYINQTISALELITRSIVTFDAGFAHQTLATSYNYTNAVNDTRDDFSNNYTNNNLDSQSFQHTIVSPPSTIFYSKNYFHYNMGNYADTAWYVTFQNGNYFKTTKYYYTFNAQNLIDETYVFESTDSVNYTTKIKSKNYYNSNNEIDSTVSYFWQTGTWYKYTKKQYTYNINNKRTSSEILSYNTTTQLYNPSSRVEYLRNNGTLLDSTFHQLYNQTSQKYDTLNKYGFIYYNGLLMHEHSYTFNQSTSVWEPTSQVSVINYFYNMLPNSTNDVSASENFSLYPNPCESYLILNTANVGTKFAIYTVEGKFIQSGSLNLDHKIYVQTLPEGMYIIKAETQGRRIQELFIKQ